jgi:hypothetical protein
MKKTLYFGLCILMLFITLHGALALDPDYEGKAVCFPPGEACGQFVESILQYCEKDPYNVWEGGISCYDKTIYEYGCDTWESDFLAKDYFQIGSYFYANIDDVVYCPKGCDETTNECKGDVPVPDCSEGSVKCNGNTIIECKNGEWVDTQTCDPETPCQYITRNYARCDYPMYYCIVDDVCTRTETPFVTHDCYLSNEQCFENTSAGKNVFWSRILNWVLIAGGIFLLLKLIRVI